MAMVLGPSLRVVMSVMISLSKPDEMCSGPVTRRLFSHEGLESSEKYYAANQLAVFISRSAPRHGPVPSAPRWTHCASRRDRSRRAVTSAGSKMPIRNWLRYGDHQMEKN